MADERKRSADGKIRLLTETYRGVLARYRDIESLSVKERDALATRQPLEGVNEMLRRKRAILDAVRRDEDEIRPVRAWWDRSRRTLAAESTGELMSVFDEISETLERTLGLEAECRRLLTEAVGFRNAAPIPAREAPLRAVAERAYTPEASPSGTEGAS